MGHTLFLKPASIYACGGAERGANEISKKSDLHNKFHLDVLGYER